MYDQKPDTCIKHIERIVQGFILILILIIAVVCVVSLVSFTVMLLLSQNDLRVLSQLLLSRYSEYSLDEVMEVTKFIETLHSMQTVIDHTQILALIYAVLSTICVGIGVYFINRVYSLKGTLEKQANELNDKVVGLTEKANKLDDKFNNINEALKKSELNSNFYATCNSLYSYCMLLRLFYTMDTVAKDDDDIQHGITECILSIKASIEDCKKISTNMKVQKQKPSLSILSYARRTMEALAKKNNDTEVADIVKEIDKILRNF